MEKYCEDIAFWEISSFTGNWSAEKFKIAGCSNDYNHYNGYVVVSTVVFVI